MAKTCLTCRHRFVAPDSPKYGRCAKANAQPMADASLCGEMRKGDCGPEGRLWEKADG